MTTSTNEPDGSGTELLDVLGPDGSVIGTADRETVHRLGHWHRTFHCLAVRTRPPARVILQRRNRRSAFPLLLDLTGSGHLEAGEEPLDGVRELEEEAGIVADPDRLVPLGVHYLVDDRADSRNREQIHVYLYPTDIPLEELRPSAREVDGLLEVSADELLELLDPARPDRTEIEALEMTVGHSPVLTTIAADDLVPDNNRYFTKVLIMAQRLANGQSPIAV